MIKTVGPGLSLRSPWTKPETAVDLNRSILSVLDENQVYRIDHYLGKETVQNIMAFRFGNSIFEPLWNRRYVSHVHITVAEAVCVEGRGGYYDNSGTLATWYKIICCNYVRL